MGTFYRYSADWGRVAAAEVLSERGASAEEGGRPTLLVMSGTKRSKVRATVRVRVRVRVLHRDRRACTTASAAARADFWLG